MSAIDLPHRWHWDEFRFDWVAAAIVALFVGSQLLALAHALAIGPQDTQLFGTLDPKSPAAGASLSGIIVVEAVVIVGVIMLWERLPESLQRIIGYTVAGTGMVYTGIIVGRAGLWTPHIYAIPATAFVGLAIFEYDLDHWLISATAIALSVFFGGVFGAVMGVVPMLILLVGVTVYDHVFADRWDAMFDIAKYAARLRLPMLVIVPRTLRIDMDDIADAVDGDDEAAERIEHRAALITGNGDLIFPGAFAAAVATYGSLPPVVAGLSWPVLGIVAGTALAALRIRARDESGAGLPTLASGGVLGYAAGWAIGHATVLASGVIA